MEQPRVEHDLTVGDRDQVGRDVGAEVAGVGLGDRQRGERAAAALRRQLRRALQQPRVHVEHVAGIRLAAGRLAGQQRDLAVGGGVLGQVVDHDQRVAAAIAEILRHREAGERRDPLQAGRVGGCGDDEDAALRRAVRGDRVDGAPDARGFLADRDIDADDVAGFLVDDRVDGDRRLADGAVADDQLALAAAEGEQRVDDEQARSAPAASRGHGR